METPHPTERLASGVFAAALCVALAAWAWMTVWEGMGHRAEWWAAVLAASVAAGAAFIMDARSTAKFGRRMIAACERAPLLRLAARRYTLRSCFGLQAAAEACLVAAAPWLLSFLPAHHALVDLLILVSVVHSYGWRQNSRLWEARAHD
ncbi:MAG: hypothetical protein J4G04_06815 [Nitrosopumilaceae archaeon]|nr:hypothetical protein [Nitrosopumilaceae archaeon]